MAEKVDQMDPDEKIVEIAIERLRVFENHPFRVEMDSQMKDLQDSIKKYGIITPVIVRPRKEGYYEIISGHRRIFAAEKLGYRKVPTIIRYMTDDQAVIAMVDSNLQRERIQPSEKAFAYKMKYDVLKRVNGRDIAYPYMKKLSERYNVSSWLQISFYREIYTVEVVEPLNSYYSYVPKHSSNLPLHASASGKLRIAYMPENERDKVLDQITLEVFTEKTISDKNHFKKMIKNVYDQEYATEIEELHVGVSSIAVPVFNSYGELKGTLSVAASAQSIKKNFYDILSELKITRNIIEHYNFRGSHPGKKS